jgi:fatty-acyl-CoA synthase
MTLCELLAIDSQLLFTSVIMSDDVLRKGSVQSPKQVVVVDSLPLTGLGKPDKKALRAKFWEDADRAVG